MTDSYIKQVAERAYGAGRTDAFTEMNSKGLSFTNIDEIITSIPKPEPVGWVDPEYLDQVADGRTSHGDFSCNRSEPWGLTIPVYLAPPYQQAEIDRLKTELQETTNTAQKHIASTLELMIARQEIKELKSVAVKREAFINDLLIVMR